MIERAVYVRLRTDADVAALVVGRIYHSMARQSTALPYIVLRRISTEHGAVFDGPDGLSRARVQVDCYDDDAAGMWDLSEKVRLCLLRDGWMAGSYRVTNCVLLDTRDLTEPPFDGSDRPAFRVSADYAVWFYEEQPA